MNGFIKLLGAVVISGCLGWCFFRRRDDSPPRRRRNKSPTPPSTYSRNVYHSNDSYNNYPQRFNQPSSNDAQKRVVKTPTIDPLPSISKPSRSSSSKFSSAAKQPAPKPSPNKPSRSSQLVPETPSSSSKQFSSAAARQPAPKPSPIQPSEQYRLIPTPKLALPPPPSSPPYTSEVKSSLTDTVKPTIRLASSSSTDRQTRAEYIWVQKGKSPVYDVPQNVESLIDQDKVPEVLRRPLSASSYRKYFAALLYAEDSYLKKWSEFQLFDMALELKHSTIYRKDESFSKKVVKKTFVSFEIDAVPEKRPYLLSRDFVFVRLSDGKSSHAFQGLIYQVQRSTSVLVEFGQDFLSQHQPTFKYDVSFSFNRVCLKRFHRAIEVASNRSYLSGFLFPDSESAKRTASKATSLPLVHQIPNYRLDKHQRMAVHRILNLHGAPPYLVEGPPSVKMENDKQKLSRTGLVVKEAVVQLYRQSSRNNRILICAPLNKTCDALIESLKEDIKDHEMFRVNAAFRLAVNRTITLVKSLTTKHTTLFAVNH
ncbi:Probable RNA helicase SDE3 [Linum grandiflorum]